MEVVFQNAPNAHGGMSRIWVVRIAGGKNNETNHFICGHGAYSFESTNINNWD